MVPRQLFSIAIFYFLFLCLETGTTQLAASPLTFGSHLEILDILNPKYYKNLIFYQFLKVLKM